MENKLLLSILQQFYTVQKVALMFIPDWITGIRSISFLSNFIKSFLIPFNSSVSILKFKFRHNNPAQACWSQVRERVTSCHLYIICIIHFFFNKDDLINFYWQHRVAPDLFFSQKLLCSHNIFCTYTTEMQSIVKS